MGRGGEGGRKREIQRGGERAERNILLCEEFGKEVVISPKFAFSFLYKQTIRLTSFAFSSPSPCPYSYSFSLLSLKSHTLWISWASCSTRAGSYGIASSRLH